MGIEKKGKGPGSERSKVISHYPMKFCLWSNHLKGWRERERERERERVSVCVYVRLCTDYMNHVSAKFFYFQIIQVLWMQCFVHGAIFFLPDHQSSRIFLSKFAFAARGSREYNFVCIA